MSDLYRSLCCSRACRTRNRYPRDTAGAIIDGPPHLVPGVPTGFRAGPCCIVVYGPDAVVQRNFASIVFALAAFPDLKLIDPL